jgi:argininosuccinate lyase
MRHALHCPLHMQGSQAYAKALAKAGILTGEEAATIVEGLSKVSVGQGESLAVVVRTELVSLLVCQ